jgi:hypothetical protein
MNSVLKFISGAICISYVLAFEALSHVNNIDETVSEITELLFGDNNVGAPGASIKLAMLNLNAPASHGITLLFPSISLLKQSLESRDKLTPLPIAKAAVGSKWKSPASGLTKYALFVGGVRPGYIIKSSKHVVPLTLPDIFIITDVLLPELKENVRFVIFTSLLEVEIEPSELLVCEGRTETVKVVPQLYLSQNERE